MITFDSSVAFEKYPDFEVAFLIAAASPVGIEDGDERAQRIMSRLAAKYASAEELIDNPLAESYRQFYMAMNVRPRAASTPLKQAARILEKGYRPIHPVVDTCMEIEYVTLCSFQVYDMDRLGKRVSYVLALGDEEFPERVHGDGPNKLRAGELALVDELGFINSPMCGNAASRIVRSESKNVLVRIFKVPDLGADVFRSAVSETAERLGAKHVIVLDRSHPVEEVED